MGHGSLIFRENDVETPVCTEQKTGNNYVEGGMTVCTRGVQIRIIRIQSDPIRSDFGAISFTLDWIVLENLLGIRIRAKFTTIAMFVNSFHVQLDLMASGQVTPLAVLEYKITY